MYQTTANIYIYIYLSREGAVFLVLRCSSLSLFPYCPAYRGTFLVLFVAVIWGATINYRVVTEFILGSSKSFPSLLVEHFYRMHERLGSLAIGTHFRCNKRTKNNNKTKTIVQPFKIIDLQTGAYIHSGQCRLRIPRYVHGKYIHTYKYFFR